MMSKIKIKYSLLFLFPFLLFSNVYAQFHDYSVKFGFQGQLLLPRTEFDNDAYKLSLLGRGFIRTELSPISEVEIGAGLGQLNGKDFVNKDWSTDIYPLDFQFILSPFYFQESNLYFFSGISVLRWKISQFPVSTSEIASKELGWDFAVPLGSGIELMLSEEILLDIRGGYNFIMSDEINYFTGSNTNDGYFNFGFGLTFVVGGGNTDRDKDGLTKNYELKIGTNPFLNDTDGDKISDGDEVKVYNTDPLKFDSDGDSLNDYEEIIEYNLDPNSADTDGDNISDYLELTKYYTDPLNKDSDADGISDNYELNRYFTNPSMKDSDKDNLSDNEELKKFNTDPQMEDTDGDGISDGQELLVDMTDPLDSNSYKDDEIDDKVLYLGNEPIILQGVFFETNSTVLKPGSETALNQVFSILQNEPDLQIEIRGYTDNVGNYIYNKELSKKRADEVKLWLVRKGIDALRIKTVGYGEMNPIADNDTPNGRLMNRRIEIYRTVR